MDNPITVLSMPPHRRLSSVAAALVSLAATVALLAACPRGDVDHSSALAGPVPTLALSTEPSPPDPLAEHAEALRASRGRQLAVAAQEEADARAILEQARTRALEQQRLAEQKLNAARPLPAPVMDAAFWRRLGPGCESSTGTGGNGGGYFQFAPGTARKVGYFPGATYDQQQAMAERWLAMIGGPAHGGGRSGWPTCWWRALRG